MSAECLLSSHMKLLQNWWSSHRSCSTTSLLTEGKPGGGGIIGVHCGAAEGGHIW